MSQSKVVRLMRQMSAYMADMDDADAELFLADLEAVFRARERAGQKRVKPAGKSELRANPNDVVDWLRQVNTREEGMEFLNREVTNRRELAQVSRVADVYISKEDTIDKIREKLIEALVGSRLNSMAIRGE